MYDVNVFDDAGFAEFLMNSRIVKPGNEKYFVHWVCDPFTIKEIFGKVIPGTRSCRSFSNHCKKTEERLSGRYVRLIRRFVSTSRTFAVKVIFHLDNVRWYPLEPPENFKLRPPCGPSGNRCD